MRTWIRFAVAPALLAILWTTLAEQCTAQGRGRGGGGGGARAGGGGRAVVSGNRAVVSGNRAVVSGNRAVVNGNRAYVNPGIYNRGYGGYGYGGYGYGGLGYGLAGFGLGYGLGSGLGGYGLGGYGYGGGYGSGYGSGYYGGNSYYNTAPVQDYQSFYPPSDNGGSIPAYSENGRGRIEVHVPANAQIIWNGAPSALTGPTRAYLTLPLGPAGATHTFEARWTDANGQVVSQTRTVQAMPNQAVTVDFNQPAVNQ
jgi:hypothetical protein